MKYKKLSKKFSDTASWAVWNDEQPSDTDVITNEKEMLRDDIVMLSLFPPRWSAESEWGNFHGDKAGQKLMHLFSSSSYRGAYITSVFKSERTEDDVNYKETQLQLFLQEMKWLGASRKTLFILFGNATKELFFDELIHRFNNVVLCEHYHSFRLSTEDWAHHNEALLQEHQRKTAVSFKLKPFRRLDNKYV
jgi:hypothetical protein